MSSQTVFETQTVWEECPLRSVTSLNAGRYSCLTDSTKTETPIQKALRICEVSCKMLQANTMKKESKEDSRANFVSLRILGTLSCVPSNRWTMRVQQVMQVTSMQGLPHFNPFLEENNFIHHLYCQTQRMFTWELTAALLDKGKVSARGDSTEWGLPAGSCLTISWLNLCCGWGIWATLTWITDSSSGQDGYHKLLH